jgi:ADP-ribose pyrophosphatase YjhB (NUDIX family)
MLKATAAGGLVVKDGKVLMVRVENLKGEKVWTFPKGHLDPGETAQQAAVREVLEETGWACEIESKLMDAHYVFSRSQGQVSKTVHWFKMKAVKKAGDPDKNEVLAAKWTDIKKASGLLTYKSDLELLETFLKG